MTVFESVSNAVEDALASDDNHPDDIARAVLLAAREAALDLCWVAAKGTSVRDSGVAQKHFKGVIDAILAENEGQ